MLKLIEGINSIVKGTKDRKAKENKVDLAMSIKLSFFLVKGTGLVLFLTPPAS